MKGLDCVSCQRQFLSFIVTVGLLGWLVCLGSFAAPAQQSTPQPGKPATQKPTPPPVSTPTPGVLITTSPQPTPSPRSTPFVTPAFPGPSPAVVNTPSPQSTPLPALALPGSAQVASALTLEDALRLANAQASTFQQAGISTEIAEEDVKQSQAAFLPRVSAPIDYIFTSPALGLPSDTPHVPSFIAANAVNEYQAVVNVAGDLDLSGRLRATLAKNQALLAAARAGTEVARRALAQAVVEAYYGLALASAQRTAAEQNLAAAQEFEHITSLLLSGGEVAPVDLTRAELQTTARRDELERARGNAAVAEGALRVLIGYDFLKPITTVDLSLQIPVDDEVSRITADTMSRRPEFAQFEAERRAAAQEALIARAERRPQLSYSINGGFDTDSLRAGPFKEHSGISAAFSLSIPIFDWGASRSRERQARLRAQLAESQRSQALRGFSEQFYSAQAQAVTAAARIRIARAGILQAENNLRVSIARYRTGEAQIIEVTDAETTLVTERQALYQAIFDYQVALARLKQAAGR